jgi:hypothetical protein
MELVHRDNFEHHAISYWQMYGFNMLLQMVLERNTFVEEDRWNRALMMLYVSLVLVSWPDRKGAKF